MPSNRDHIQEYFTNGFQLVPLAQIQVGGKDKVIPNTYGKPVLNESKTGLNPEIALADYEAFIKFTTEHQNITMMGFYPMHNDYLVLDLDKHGEDGITNFLKLCKAAKLSSKMLAMLQDFPNNFPCWVETPHQGIHLYFKADYVPRNWNKKANENGIDIKYNNQITAAGSIRGDASKTDVNYIMHGFLEDAPQITLDLLDVFTKPKPAPAKTFQYKPKAFAGNTMEANAKWNETPEGIIEKAREKHAGNAHETIMWMAKYFAMAGYPKEVALASIEATPEHQNRNDKADTKTCVLSFYR